MKYQYTSAIQMTFEYIKLKQSFTHKTHTILYDFIYAEMNTQATNTT